MRFLLESCIEVGLCSLIAVKMIEKETFLNGWEVFAIISAIMTLLLLLIAPVYYCSLVRKYLSDVDKPKHKRKVSKEEMEIQKKIFEDFYENGYSMCYPVAFTLRRYAVIIILTVMPGLKYAQIFGHIFSTMFVIDYLLVTKPYLDQKLNF